VQRGYVRRAHPRKRVRFVLQPLERTGIRLVTDLDRHAPTIRDGRRAPDRAETSRTEQAGYRVAWHLGRERGGRLGGGLGRGTAVLGAAGPWNKPSVTRRAAHHRTIAPPRIRSADVLERCTFSLSHRDAIVRAHP
jgi:hypothetical protein